MNKPRFIVIAGNFSQYKQCLRQNRINPQSAIYATAPEHIYGIQDATVVKTGEYWLSPLADDPYLISIETLRK